MGHWSASRRSLGMGLGLGGSPNQAPGFSAVICTDEWAVRGGGQRTQEVRSKAYRCWSDTHPLMPPTQSPDWSKNYTSSLTPKERNWSCASLPSSG